MINSCFSSCVAVVASVTVVTGTNSMADGITTKMATVAMFASATASQMYI